MPTDSILDIPSACVNGAHSGWADTNLVHQAGNDLSYRVPEG